MQRFKAAINSMLRDVQKQLDNANMSDDRHSAYCLAAKKQGLEDVLILIDDMKEEFVQP